MDAINFLSYVKPLPFICKDDAFLFMAEDLQLIIHMVTHPALIWVELDLTYKWNMGFMNDVLRYFKEDPIPS